MALNPASQLNRGQFPVLLPERLPRLIVEEETGDLPALHLPPSVDACPFCGAYPVGEEHVFARWISRELARYGRFVSQTPYGPKESTAINLKAPVCVLCNNRWLSVLENDVRTILAPMIHGAKSVSLSMGSSELLATWAVKTAIMLDLSYGTPIIPAGFYRDLRLQRRPLDSHRVLLGAYNGRRALRAIHRGMQFGAGKDGPPLGFVTTFSVFRTLFQVLGHFTAGGAIWNDNRQLSVGFHTIWPAGDAINWPRDGLAFNDDAVDDLDASARDSIAFNNAALIRLNPMANECKRA